MFTQKDLNLRQQIRLELLKDYDIRVLYHPSMGNVVMDFLSRMTMGSVSNVEVVKNGLVIDVHRLDQLGIRLENSPKWWFCGLS